MSGGHYEYKCMQISEFAEVMEIKNDPDRRWFAELLFLCGDAAKAIEWEDSDDTGPEHTKEMIKKVHDYKMRPEEKIYKIDKYFICHDGTYDRFLSLLLELRNSTNLTMGSRYIHQQDVDFWIEAVKEKKDRDNK